MADSTIHLKVVTPTGKLFEGEVQSCVATGVGGAFEVLPEHIAFLTAVIPGPLRFSVDREAKSFAIGDGFLQVAGTKVTCMTSWAVESSALDAATVKDELASAEKQLAAYGPDDAEYITATRAVADARGKAMALP